MNKRWIGYELKCTKKERLWSYW